MSTRRALAFLVKEKKKRQNSLEYFITFGPHTQRCEFLGTRRAGSHRFGRNNGMWFQERLRPVVIIEPNAYRAAVVSEELHGGRR